MTTPTIIDVYCDESCHLERDGSDLMVLGAVAVPHARLPEVVAHLRDLKVRHGLPRRHEAKWTKVSPSKVAYYLALIDFFLQHDALRFRGWVARGKSQLRHDDFGQSHDDWYYKMYWEMLRVPVRAGRHHRIYVDIKDTRGGAKVRKLHEVLATSMHDWDRESIQRIQIVRSHEVEILQLTDVLVGALGYRSRGLATSPAKLAVVERLESGAGLRLDWNTPVNRAKVNVFHWLPQAKTGG